jgi:hypothetical protein
MKKLSYWALLNMHISQPLLLLFQFLLFLLSIYLGVILFAADIYLPIQVVYISTGIFFLIAIIYPIRRARYKFWKFSYYKQKSMDFILQAVFFVICTTFFNQQAGVVSNASNTSPMAMPIVYREHVPVNVSPQVFKHEKHSKGIKALLKMKFVDLVEKVKGDEKKASGGDVFSIILVILVAIGFIFLIAWAACALSCSGNTALAALVGIGGTALIIYGVVLAIRSIVGKRKNRYEPMPQS